MEFNCNGLTNDTVDLIGQFQYRIKKLHSRVSSTVILEYLMDERKTEGIPEEIYQEIEQLKAIEAQAVINEYAFIEYCAKDEGIEIPAFITEIYENGKIETIPAMVSFPEELYEKIPSIKVFTPFVWL